MSTNRTGRLGRYYAVVCVGGFGALAAGLVAERVAFEGERLGILFLVVLVVAGELFPIRLSRGEERRGAEIPTSTTFAFALLVMAGIPATMVALGGASLVAGFAARKPTMRVAFDFARYALALSAARLVLSLAGSPAEVIEQARQVGLPMIVFVLAAGFAFFAFNHVLASAADAIESGEPLLRCLTADAVFQASTTGVLLILSPVIVTSAVASPLLVPLLAVLMALLHRYAATMMANERHALHDGITGLANRGLFARRVDVAITVAPDLYHGVLLIDLDQFKEVNDTLGHSFGDRLLAQVGHRLVEVIPDGAVAARLGGDEFAVLFPPSTRDDAVVAGAHDLLRALGRRYDIDDLVLEAGASAGLAIGPGDGPDAATLVQRAEVAMYQSKRDRNGMTRYHPRIDGYSPERLAMFAEVREAVERHELVVFYQPKADIATGLITGVEALVRWEHPRLGLVGPDAFLPLIHQGGLTRDLTLLVLEEAMAQCRRWHEQGLLLGIAVNVTDHDLTDPRFLADVARLLEKYKLSPAWLELEITEETVMRDAVRLMGVLAILREMGIQLALDDFGTGYSSLAYLSRLRVAELKIDKSFVMGMDTSDNNRVIVKSTIDLAHSLGMRTVAEGVEDADCWEALRALGCDVVQGYYLKRPLAASELTPWLHGRCARMVDVP
jgi:diguanylate cyclase (GGDEF)-like protein